MSDISSMLYNNDNIFHIFGFSESRLNSNISDSDLKIPGFKIIRKDSTKHKETGLLVYLNDSISFRRIHEFENSNIECIWLEIYFNKINLLFLAFYIVIL